jgi:hypothetical protein
MLLKLINEELIKKPVGQFDSKVKNFQYKCASCIPTNKINKEKYFTDLDQFRRDLFYQQDSNI